MKVAFFDEKEGEIKLIIESEDDLWHLSNIATEDGKTLARMRTVRKVKKEISPERTEAEKVTTTLGILVERVEYHPFSGALRITGKVCEENDFARLGSYHTFSVEPRESIFLRKEGGISSLDWERIRASRRTEPKVLILLIDRDEAIFASVSGEGVNWGIEVESSLPPKSEASYEPMMRDYFGRVLAALESLSERAEAIVIAGPGNAKENFSDFAKDKGFSRDFLLENASSATRAALKEVVSSGVSKILEESSIAKEAEAVEAIFAKIGKGSDKVAYGIDSVENASLAGAVETLLVSDGLIKKARLEGKYQRLESLIKSAEKSRATIRIISSTHEAGQKLLGLGGLAAILRYSLGGA